MKLINCFLLLFWAMTSICLGSQWFVSTNGSGNGSITNPWSLQVALTSSTIKPGDTIWLRGGTYFPTSTWPSWNVNVLGWAPNINGNSTNLITLRSYTNEWAAIDREWTLTSSSYLRFRDLEFYDSLKGNNLTNSQYPQGPWVHFAGGNSIGGFEWINCVIHDVDNCWGQNAAGNSIRGCILWYVGWSGLEHVCYPAPLTFSGNISAWHSCNVINLNIQNGTLIQSNIMFGSGQSLKGATWGDIQTGSYDYTISHNYFYNNWPNNPPISPPEGSVYLSSAPSGNAVFANNVVASQTPLKFTGDAFISMTITNNTLFMDSSGQSYQVIQQPTEDGTWTIDHNSYFARSPNQVAFRSFVTNYYTFSQWQSVMGFDVHSTSADSTNPPDAVYVVPNQDQPKRCHIAIYNFSRVNNITVNLSGILTSGDNYKLYSAQNYNAGPIQSGVFNGTNISVPMTNLTTAPILYGTNTNPFGQAVVQPPPPSPEFGAFVVIGSPHIPVPPENVHVVYPP